MSTISASTTSTTAYKVTADTTGTLVLQTGSTPTTAVTIDTSQNVGIGTTSPGSILETKAVSPYIRSTTSNIAGNTHGLEFYETTSRRGFVEMDNSAGVLKVGTIPGWATTFYTNNTERARIDSSGKFIVGQTSTTINGSYSPILGSVVTGTTGQAASFGATSGSYTGQMLITSSISTGSTSWSHAYGAYGNGSSITTDAYYIYGNGNIQNRNNSYAGISDIKLKENITDATPKLAQLNQVRIVNYNFIGEEHKQLGVIAQELEQIFPGMVEETADYENVTTTDEEGNEITERVATGTTTKSVKYSVFVPMLIKAIQEQQAIIETLTNRISALENK